MLQETGRQKLWKPGANETPKSFWSNEGRLVELAAHSKPVLIESTRKPSACFRILATVARCADAFGTINSSANPTLFIPRNLPQISSLFTRSGDNEHNRSASVT